jgi:hypothetical protein
MRHEHDPAPKRRWRPSYAAVASTLALVLALGGTAYALVVTSADIQNGTIQTEDLHKNAVTGNKVKNGTLTGSDIKNGTIDVKDLTAAAQQDPRLQTFTTIVVPWTATDTPVVTVSTDHFTFTAKCYDDPFLSVDDAFANLSSNLDGWNSAYSLLGELTDGSTWPDTGVLVDINHNQYVPVLVGLTSDNPNGGTFVISGIAPTQGDGSIPSVLVQGTATVLNGGCTFVGTVTDTTTYP